MVGSKNDGEAGFGGSGGVIVGRNTDGAPIPESNGAGSVGDEGTGSTGPIPESNGAGSVGDDGTGSTGPIPESTGANGAVGDTGAITGDILGVWVGS